MHARRVLRGKTLEWEKNHGAFEGRRITLLITVILHTQILHTIAFFSLNLEPPFHGIYGPIYTRLARVSLVYAVLIEEFLF